MSKPWEQCVTLEDYFLHFLDCQLATIEELHPLKRVSKHRLRRHREVAKKMILAAQRLHLPIESNSRVQEFEKGNDDGRS